MIDNTTQSFIQDFGMGFFQEIFYVLNGDAVNNAIRITHMNKIDELNKEGYGEFVTPVGTVIKFGFEDGTKGGSVITEYGTDVKVKSPKRTVYRFKLNESKFKKSDLAFVQKKFKAIESRIREMERQFNYDIKHSPTLQTKDYYNKYLEKMNLKVVEEEVDVDWYWA